MADAFKQPVLENDAGSALATAGSLPKTASLRWGFINSWKVEPQSDDRPPVYGGVTPSTAAPAPRRSSARRKHQEMFKAWSQDRHE